MPPTMARHVPWKVMVNHVGLTQKEPDQRRIIPNIGIFRPVNDAGDEIRQHDGQDGLDK